MIMRNLVISLGITTLSSFLLYMYFKNRMSDVENKVDIMFQLIQEHTAANEAATKAAEALHSVNFQAPNMQVSEQETSSNNLVDVSDDDMGGSSSEEVSDSEDEDDDETDSVVPRLDESDIQNLRDNIFAEETNTIKKINLNIQGSETSAQEQDIVLDNLEDLNLDSNKEHSNDEQDEDVELEEVDANNLEIDGASVNLTLNAEDVVVHKSQSPTEEENNENEDTQEDEDDDVEEDLSNITLEENNMDSVKTIVVNEVMDLDENELRKKTVAQLKEIAAQKNLQKYKSLTKKRLIDLISNSH